MDMQKQNLLDALKLVLASNEVPEGEVRQAVRKAVEAVSEKRTEEEEQFLTLAKAQHEVEGECEFDDDAVVSLSEDSDGIVGAYVQAWVFVYAPESEGA